MCECKDCENFKAKKRGPQVGDRVYSEKHGHVGIFAGRPNFNPMTGGAVIDWAFIIRDDGIDGSDGMPWSTSYKNLTVID